MISISFILGMVSNQSQGFLKQWLQAIDIADVADIADIADATTYVHWSPTLSKLNNLGKLSFRTRISSNWPLTILKIFGISADFPMLTLGMLQTVVPVTPCCFSRIFPQLFWPHPSWYPSFSTNHGTSWRPSDPNGSRASVYSMDETNADGQCQSN